MSDLYIPGNIARDGASSRYVLPSFVERTNYGVKESNPYNKLFEERIIFLGVQVDDASANDIMAQLLVLESLAHMAAVGALDFAVIHVLMMDVDHGNGNLARTLATIKHYNAFRKSMGNRVSVVVVFMNGNPRRRTNYDDISTVSMARRMPSIPFDASAGRPPRRIQPITGKKKPAEAGFG